MFMNSVRPKSAIFKFKVTTKEKSESVLQSSPSTAQNVTDIWSSKRQNDMKFGGWKEKTISNKFYEEYLLKF